MSNPAKELLDTSGLTANQLARAFGVPVNAYFGWIYNNEVPERYKDHFCEFYETVESLDADTPEERRALLLESSNGRSIYKNLSDLAERGQRIQYDIPVLERLGIADIGDKTTVYIDVDGVINSFIEDRKLSGWSGEWKKEKVMGYWIHWYTDLVDSLNKFDKMENVTVKWLTTWQDNAVTHLCEPLGINGKAWEVVYALDKSALYVTKVHWWKLKAMQKDIEETNPDKVVWIDDDISFERTACEWISDQGSKIHAISPFTDVGMTKEDFDGIIEYINS